MTHLYGGEDEEVVLVEVIAHTIPQALGGGGGGGGNGERRDRNTSKKREILCLSLSLSRWSVLCVLLTMNAPQRHWKKRYSFRQYW